jgi:hypothetical protein
MDAQQFNDIAIGTPVTVYSFGIHHGRAASKHPIVTTQNRTFTADDWLKVAIAAPDETTREWNGAYEDVEINSYAMDGLCHNAEPGTSRRFQNRSILGQTALFKATRLSVERRFGPLRIARFRCMRPGRVPPQAAADVPCRPPAFDQCLFHRRLPTKSASADRAFSGSGRQSGSTYSRARNVDQGMLP